LPFAYFVQKGSHLAFCLFRAMPKRPTQCPKPVTTGGLIRYTFNIKLCNNGETQCRNELMNPFTTRRVTPIKPNLGMIVPGGGEHALFANTAQPLSATLREGQTQVSFALVSDSPIDADQSGAVSVSYQGSGDNAQSATSNSWAITVQDAGEPANAEHPLEGDYLVKTETYTIDAPLRRTKPYGNLTVEGYAQPLFNVFPTMGILDVTAEDAANTPSSIVLEKDQLYYAQDSQGNLAKGTEAPTIRNVYNDDGEVTGTEEIPSDDKTVTDNTLFGSAAKDKINGKTGNDQIDGGSGDDMIGGGAGSDNIKGGDGNDYISSSGGILYNRQQISATDLWANWGVPDGKSAIHQGAMWGTYLSEDTAEFKVTTWAGITNTRTDKADTEGDVIDGGAGDDWVNDAVWGSWAGDRIKGGEGKDQITGGSGLNSEDLEGLPIVPKLGIIDASPDDFKKNKALGLAIHAYTATLYIAKYLSVRSQTSPQTRGTRTLGCKRRRFLAHSLPCSIAKQATIFEKPIHHIEVAP
jgi:hypothetical protein